MLDARYRTANATGRAPVPALGGGKPVATREHPVPVRTIARWRAPSTQSLECAGSTDVFLEGEDGNACGADEDCVGTGETGCDTGTGLCKFTDTIPATVGGTTSGQIDVCYTTRNSACADAKVAYCNSTTIANVNHPAHTPLFIDAEVRTVNSSDQVLDTSRTVQRDAPDLHQPR
jgi:hypothetical protein